MKKKEQPATILSGSGWVITNKGMKQVKNLEIYDQVLVVFYHSCSFAKIQKKIKVPNIVFCQYHTDIGNLFLYPYSQVVVYSNKKCVTLAIKNTDSLLIPNIKKEKNKYLLSSQSSINVTGNNIAFNEDGYALELSGFEYFMWYDGIEVVINCEKKPLMGSLNNHNIYIKKILEAPNEVV